MSRRTGRWRHAAAFVVICGVVVAAVAFQAACGGNSEPIPSTDESIAAGAALFELDCQVCHGLDGRGSELAPDLTVHVRTRSNDFLFGRISQGFVNAEGVRVMPAFKNTLNETERWHLVNFIRASFGVVTFVTPEG